MKTRHTPGPWSTNYVGTYGHVVRGANPNAQVANVLTRGDYLTTAEAKANARLIAAAPDLLAALIEAENALADYVPTIEKTGATLNYGHAVIRQASAAIAQATGGTS